MGRTNRGSEFRPDPIARRIAALWLPAVIWVYLVCMLVASVELWHGQYHPIYFAVAVLVAGRFTRLRFVMAVAGAAIGLSLVTGIVNHSALVSGILSTLSLVVVCAVIVVMIQSRDGEARELRQITMDLRQALTVIMGDAQFIERYSPHMTEPQTRAIGRIIGASRRAALLLGAIDHLPSQRL
ncbi:MAG TPA: hypothetical protein VMW65_12320 [Chloroflexota bacterium]|nr:hypothetical protein [Chloroflexota bacterium]